MASPMRAHRSPSETDDAARVAIAPPEMDAAAAANRILADTRWGIRSLFGFLYYTLSSFVHGSTGDDRDGIAENETTDPRRPLAHRRIMIFGDDDDTAIQSSGGNSITSTSDTTRRPGTAHATPLGEGRRHFTFTANVDGSRGQAYRSSVAARDSNEAPAYAAVIGLLAYGSCVVIGLLTEFDHTVGGWSAAATVSYGLMLLLTASLLAFGVMASVEGSRTMLCVSDFCARLGAILCTALLIVVISCKMGRPWGCHAGVPFAAVVACAMGAIGIWGRARAMWARAPEGSIQEQMRMSNLLFGKKILL
ncbi:unnamed protein product [Urochloa decumbens]|uniref:Uncharacterized protein n=1 Tax=Urochloa decumbens TaxID=240449 RepID=A0ABC8W9H3_9POAL